MDLISILRERTNALPPGGYSAGLKAVLHHIEVASSHLTRGTTYADESAFTDAIYRTNQAFEGSLKEAYRVLTGKEPDRLRPSDIETYLQNEGLLRQRVLAQFSNYRKEWRNPSTHDYRLDFDEDEALLAIVSVCAFAIVLCDQIAEKLSFETAKASTQAPTTTIRRMALLDTVVEAIKGFRFQPTRKKRVQDHVREAELVGSLGGFLSALLPDAEINLEAKLGSERSVRPDMLISRGNQRIIVEVKRAAVGSGLLKSVGPSTHQYLEQAGHYIALSGVRGVLIYVHPEDPEVELVADEHGLPGVNARVVILSPRSKD